MRETKCYAIPGCLTGREVLDRYQGITDVVTCIDPAVEYPVRQATRHPIRTTRGGPLTFAFEE